MANNDARSTTPGQRPVGRMYLEEYFRSLRFDADHHVGMGDIRLTIGQQEDLVDAIFPPSERGQLLIEVFWQPGDQPFVCGANGPIGNGTIEEIEKQFADDHDWCIDVFRQGRGLYLFEAKHESYEEDGIADLWDLSLVKFVAC